MNTEGVNGLYRPSWHEARHCFDCPKCGQPAGQPCKAKDGLLIVARHHSERVQQARRIGER